MRHFYLVVHPEKDRDLQMTKSVKEKIEAKGGTCETGMVVARKSGVGLQVDAEKIPEDTEGIIVIGGDGSLIQTARDTRERNLPIMGINMGSLGYLSEVEASEVDEALDKLFADECLIEERMLLEGEIIRGTKVCYSGLAMNEVLLSRLGSPRVIRYRIWVNGQFLYEYDADAILVATPTGSTAYNLSAGGPIVLPEASLFVVTPVCAHSLNSRSIVLPETAEICITVENDREGSGGWQTAFDGVPYDGLKRGDEVRIRKAEQKTRLIKLRKDSFLETLSRKMQNL